MPEAEEMVRMITCNMYRENGGDGAGLVNVADPKSDETVYESAFSYASISRKNG